MTPQQIEALKLALEAMKNNKLTHLYCEDIWYSCPKHEDGCANEAEGDECNCGADEVNAEFDKAITALEEVLAEHAMQEVQRLGQEIEQEPVALHCCGYTDASAVKWNPFNRIMQCHNCGQTYTPPQRKPLTEDELADLWYKQSLDWLEFARAIEAAHGIKE